MANKLYKIGESIEIGYQAPNAESGLEDVIAEIYLPGKVKDSSYPDVELVEVDDTGTYRGSFTPDAVGVWQTIIHKAGVSSKEGQVVKAYSVGNYNIHEIGTAVDALQDALTALGDVAVSGDITAAQTVVTDAITALHNIDAAGVQAAAAAAITAAGLATSSAVADVKTVVDGIADSIASLDTPPMAF